MATQKLTRRSRKFGWGYSFTPIRNTCDITRPSKPDYEGTVRQVLNCISSDRTWNANRSAFSSAQFFLDGKPIYFISEFDLDDLLDGRTDEIEVAYIKAEGE